LVKLLTRMYDPTSGTITADGVELRDYDLRALRNRIATVYQDHGRFSLTFGENIAIGRPELLEPDFDPDRRDELIMAAAEKGGADGVLAKLEDGLDTELTRRFGGTDLSGGEWQRVATARAFLPDAALIILDEPTSALDVDAERHLFDRFAELVRGRTAVMISHRFSTVRTADQIAVLADGRIAECGSHEELIALGGRYAELFNLQADRYR
jgi:ATP-binding cassette subfamily B protein